MLSCAETHRVIWLQLPRSARGTCEQHGQSSKMLQDPKLHEGEKMREVTEAYEIL